MMMHHNLSDQRPPQAQTIEQKLSDSIYNVPAKLSPLGKESSALSIVIAPENLHSVIKFSLNSLDSLESFIRPLLKNAANSTEKGVFDLFRSDLMQSLIAEAKKVVLISAEELEQLPQVVKKYDINFLSIQTLDPEISAEQIAKIFDLIKAQTNIEALQLKALRLSTQNWAKLADLTNTSNFNMLVLRGCYLSDAEARVLTAISKKLILSVAENNIEWATLSDLYAKNNLYLIADSNPGSSHPGYEAAVCEQLAFFLANKTVKTALEKIMQKKLDAKNPKIIYDYFNPKRSLAHPVDYATLNNIARHVFELGQAIYQVSFPTPSLTSFIGSSTLNIFSNLKTSIDSLASSLTSGFSVAASIPSAPIVAAEKSSTSPTEIIISSTKTLLFNKEPKPRPSPTLDLDQLEQPIRYTNPNLNISFANETKEERLISQTL